MVGWDDNDVVDVVVVVVVESHVKLLLLSSIHRLRRNCNIGTAAGDRIATLYAV